MLKKFVRSSVQLSCQLRKLFRQPKFAVLTIAALGIVLLCIFTPLRAVFDPFLFKDFIEQYESYVEIIFIAIYIVLTVIGVPGTVLTIVGGSLFGIWYGTLISIVSATLGALCAFWTARYLFRDLAQRRFSQSKKLTQFQAAVLKQPFYFVLTTRLIPISPYNLVNYLFGLTSINWLDYTWATFIGVIPGSFAYSWIGKSGDMVMKGGDRLSLFLALSFLALLSVIPLLSKRV
ncbi:MAG: TVP38/TMEM64 family protein [Cyanobacteria bacterium P01_C01_bin.72]